MKWISNKKELLLTFWNNAGKLCMLTATTNTFPKTSSFNGWIGSYQSNNKLMYCNGLIWKSGLGLTLKKFMNFSKIVSAASCLSTKKRLNFTLGWWKRKRKGTQKKSNRKSNQRKRKRSLKSSKKKLINKNNNNRKAIKKLKKMLKALIKMKRKNKSKKNKDICIQQGTRNNKNNSLKMSLKRRRKKRILMSSMNSIRK